MYSTEHLHFIVLHSVYYREGYHPQDTLKYLRISLIRFLIQFRLFLLTGPTNDFFIHFASKNQLTGFYASGTLAKNGFHLF